MKDQIGVNRRIRWDKKLDWLAELEAFVLQNAARISDVRINSEL